MAVITALIVYATAWMTWGVDLAAAYRRAGDTTNIIATLAAATIFYVSPWLILTIISGLVLLVLIILRLDLGLALVALFAPFFFLPRQLFESAFSMSELILLMCVVAFVLRGAYSVRRTRKITLARFTASRRWTGASWRCSSSPPCPSVLADYRTFALREFRVIILEPIIYYALIRAAKLDRRAVWRIVDFLMLAGVLVAVIGLVQYAFNLNIITAEEGVRRLRSVYGSPNNVGLFLGRVFPIGLALLLLGRGRRRMLLWPGADPHHGGDPAQPVARRDLHRRAAVHFGDRPAGGWALAVGISGRDRRRRHRCDSAAQLAAHSSHFQRRRRYFVLPSSVVEEHHSDDSRSSAVRRGAR